MTSRRPLRVAALRSAHPSTIQRGLHRDNSRNGDALLLTAGKLVRCMLAVLVHVDLLSVPSSTRLADFRLRSIPRFSGRERHVLLNNGRDELVIRVLLHKAHAAAHMSSCVSSTAVSMPSTVTVPQVGTNIPLNSFAMVDLPQPLWPSSATNEPFSMSRSTPCRTSPLSSAVMKNAGLCTQ